MVARTPYARARGLGAAGTGTREYWILKLTSIAMLPLMIFLGGVLIALRDASHSEVANALSKPWIALPLFLLILANALHMRLGMAQVIDDYVHSNGLKKFAVGANLFFSYGLSAAALYFLILIGLRG
jgi:succinate dehydrogenase / fumarate reductase membrane anchor subunit